MRESQKKKKKENSQPKNKRKQKKKIPDQGAKENKRNKQKGLWTRQHLNKTNIVENRTTIENLKLSF